MGGSSVAFDADRSKIYCDLITTSLGEPARQALKNVDSHKYEYQSDFARSYVAQGGAEGGAAVLIRQITSRFGPIDSQLEGRIRQRPSGELETSASVC
jgi:hypothetical protein